MNGPLDAGSSKDAPGADLVDHVVPLHEEAVGSRVEHSPAK